MSRHRLTLEEIYFFFFLFLFFAMDITPSPNQKDPLKKFSGL